jgi:hypothetical protein
LVSGPLQESLLGPEYSVIESALRQKVKTKLFPKLFFKGLLEALIAAPTKENRSKHPKGAYSSCRPTPWESALPREFPSAPEYSVTQSAIANRNKKQRPDHGHRAKVRGLATVQPAEGCFLICSFDQHETET